MNAGFALALAVLAVIGGVTIWSSRVASRAADRRRESLVRRTELAELLLLLEDAETGQRGFLLTGLPSYLEPHERALARLGSERARLDSLMSRDTGSGPRLRRVLALTDAKVAELARTIDLRRTRGLPDALAVMRTAGGKETMDSIRALIASIDADEARATRAYDARAVDAQRITLTTGIGLGVLALAFLAGSALAFNRSYRRREEAERELAESEHRLDQILEAIPVGVFVIDADGRPWYANRESRRILGGDITPGSTLDQLPTLYQAYRAGTDELLAAEDQPIAHALQGRVSTSDTIEIRHGDTRVPIEVVAAPVFDRQGKVAHGIAAFGDISSRRAAEEAIRISMELADAANQAKSEFLARMSHELRTPLNSIIGFSEVLADVTFGPLNDRQRRYVGNVLTSGRQLLDLINDILDLSKIEAGRMELVCGRISVALLVEEVRTQLDELASRKSLTLSTAVDPHLPPLIADGVRLRQMLYNLLSNAIKYTRDGGHISVAARRAAPAGEIEYDWLEIEVQDTGIGIGPEDHERVFHDFEQGSADYVRDQQGTGLGLPLTRRLAEMHGGRIELDSAVGKGSTFRLLIPLAPPGAPHAADDEPRTQLPADAPLVLIVDDEPTAATLLCHYLAEAGYRTAVATSGDAAIEIARTMKPAAITLDLQLPDRDGLNVLARLKAEPGTRAIPIIVVSITEDRAVGFSLGATEWFVKPVSRDDLLAAVRRAIAPLASGTALVIDDDPTAVELIAEYLSQAHFQVLRALDGRTGIASALTHRPDVIVLDLLMPDVTGFDVVAALRAQPAGQDIPILICTNKDITADDHARLIGTVQGIVRKDELRGRLLGELRRATHLARTPAGGTV